MGSLSIPIKPLNDKINSVLDSFENVSTTRITLILFIVTFAAASPIIIGYEAKDRPNRESISDIDIFRDRANTILDGDLLYSDTDMVTMTPPLINYLMAPAIIFGDTVVVWELWFTFFVFLTSVIIFFILEPMAGRRLALTGGMIFASSPFGFYTCVAMIQDDAIIVIFLALSALFLLKEKWNYSAIFTGLGTLTKMFPVLVSPIIFLAPKSWKERWNVAAFGLGIAILVSLPFIIFAFDGFMIFLEFYLLGKQPSAEIAEQYSITGQRGMSLWRFLALVGFVVPTNILHASFFVAIIVCWIAVWKRKIDFYSGFTLCILAIFILYSKVHYGYHLMALMILIPWSLHDSKRIWSLLIISIFGRYVHLAWMGRLDYGSDWLYLLASFIMWSYWVWWAITIIKQPNLKKQWEEKLDHREMSLTCFQIVIVSLLVSIFQGIAKAVTW